MSTFIVETFLIVGSQLARHRRVDHLACRRLRMRRPFPQPDKKGEEHSRIIYAVSKWLERLDEASFIFLQVIG